jgi:DNA polymerase bacteriophage-type
MKELVKMILSIDIETYSSVDIKKSGVYAYAKAPDFTILLFAYSLEGTRNIIDLASGEEIPLEIIKALTDNNIIKSAFNAQFERVCLQAYFNIELPISQWQCTSVKSAMFGLPHDLSRVATILKLPVQKDSSGTELIKYFSVPCKPTKTNGNRTRNLPHHSPEKWQQFKEYCLQDVEVETLVCEKLSFFKVPENEKKLFEKDQLINDTGMLIDLDFVKNCISIDSHFQEKYKKEMQELTGVDNSKSVAQLKAFLEDEGVEVESLNKKAISELKEDQEDEKIKRVLELRSLLGKTSTAKYEAMLNSVGADGRIRGLLQFYGASRTGRWAGRIVQIQNLPQNHLIDLDEAREMIKNMDIEGLEMLYGNVPSVLSELIRTAFIAKENYVFVVADFSAIEARVIAWLAGEKWRLDVFNTHGKIYEASASKMFKVPLEQITKGSPLRQKGKISELALGYQGGAGALKQMGGEAMGLSENDMQELVNEWRNANRNIVKLWYESENAVIRAIEGMPNRVNNIDFFMQHNCLMLKLPSGRCLVYRNPRLEPHPKFQGKKAIAFDGLNQTTKTYEKQYTYGGKLTENCIQAIARDCLAEIILNINHYSIVGHVHDEVILEVPNEKADEVLKGVCALMAKEIPWAKGLPLKGEGYITKYYKKD